MNQNVKIADIICKLNEIDELIKSLNEGNLPTGQAGISSIDKDLILEKIRKVYETVLSNKAVSKTTEIITKSKPQVPIIKPVKKEVVAEPVKPVENVNDSLIDFSEKPAEKIESTVNEKKQTNAIPTLFEVEPIVSPTAIKEEDTIPVKKEKTETLKQNPSSKTISDHYRESKSQTVSDLMSKFNTNDISNKQNLKPIKNLKSAISINDRIMFTNELFDNDPDFYNEVIEKINGMNDLNEALEYLGIEINIDDDSEAVKKFIELVHRRFI